MAFDEVSAVRLEPRPAGWTPATLDDIELPDTVGFDTETTGLRWWDDDRPVGAGVSWWDGERVVSKYIAWGHRDGNVPEDNARRWLRDKLRGRRLVGLNLPFDAHQSREWGLDLEALGCRLSDIGHYAALLNDHRTSFSLNAIANDYLAEGKVEGLDMSGGAQVYPAWQVEAYGRQDVALPLRLLKIMDAELASQDLLRVRDLEDDVTWARVEMEKNGARIDVEKLARWVKESQRDLELMHLRLARDAGFRVNPDSREHMTRLFRERGLESDQLTDKGLPSYNDAVLAKLAERDPVVKLVRDAAHLADLRSKYLVPYLRDAGRTGILRTTFHQLRSTTEEGGAKGTVSGRFSSAQPVRGEGANLQQVLAVSKQKRLHGEKYLIRELFVAEPGSLVGASDAKQIEYRIFVHLSRSERLIQMYRDNPEMDFHATVGDMILKYRPDFDRKRIKNCNFARLFGAGVARISDMLSLDEEQGKEFLKVYDKHFPEARATLNQASGVAKSRGYVRTALGRRARFPEGCLCPACYGGRPRYHKALNCADQGTAADVMKLKMVLLHAERRSLGLTPRMTVHDEYVGDIGDRDGARRMDALLNRQDLPLSVPILWSTEVGANWAHTESLDKTA